MKFWNKDRVDLRLLGLAQALGVVVYCGLVGLLFWQGNNIFGKMNSYLGPVMFLVLFVMSALICALMVFYKPYVMFVGKKRKEAADLVMWTTGWLFGLLVLFMVGALIRTTL